MGSRPTARLGATTSGRVRASDLPPGQYQVEFSADGCGGTGFRTQWWQDASSQASATVITVAAGAAIADINAALSR
jgi:hypothetical protein